MKYADKKEIPIALIIGEDEFKEGVVSVKDLRAKEKLEGEIKERQKWLEARIGQKRVKVSQIVDEIKNILNYS